MGLGTHRTSSGEGQDPSPVDAAALPSASFVQSVTSITINGMDLPASGVAHDRNALFAIDAFNVN